MAENMLNNSICILSILISVLWVILMVYKAICIKKNYYSEGAWAIKFKFHYIGLLTCFIVLCFVASAVWFKSNIVFATTIILLSLVLAIGIALYLWFNHYLTTGKVEEEKITKYKKARYILAIFVSVVVFILDIVPYLI
ncbi:MAG: hypothetical protein J1E81_05770 [Eubacterium sp.]|nr:hypothetical protein [Eubacterium sp.]